jgi:hypothetical protein
VSNPDSKLSGPALTIILTVLAGGVAWGAAQVGASTAARDIAELKTKLDRHLTADQKERVLQAERFGRIEALLNEAARLGRVEALLNEAERTKNQ